MGNLYRRFVIWLYGAPDPQMEPNIRKATHDLSNEVTKLRANLRRISESEDPVEELTRTMRGNGL